MNSVEVNELYAWCSKDASGAEGIVMMPIGNLGVVPLVTTTRARADSMRGHAAVAATLRAAPVKLRRFLLAEVVDTVVPPEAN